MRRRNRSRCARNRIGMSAHTRVTVRLSCCSRGAQCGGARAAAMVGWAIGSGEDSPSLPPVTNVPHLGWKASALTGYTMSTCRSVTQQTQNPHTAQHTTKRRSVQPVLSGCLRCTLGRMHHSFERKKGTYASLVLPVALEGVLACLPLRIGVEVFLIRSYPVAFVHKPV